MANIRKSEKAARRAAPYPTGPQSQRNPPLPARPPEPVSAWQHINLYGRYEFRKTPETIDLPALIQELDQIPVQPDLAV